MTFALLDARLRSLVADVAKAEPDPLDPYRGLYVTAWQARDLAADQPVPTGIDERLASVAGRLGLDELDTAVLALAAAPSLSPHYGSLFGFLQGDAARRLASPMLIGRLLAAPGRTTAAVLRRFAHDGALRASRALTLRADSPHAPAVERAVTVADRLAAELLGTRLELPEWERRARRVAPPPERLARWEPVEELRAALAADASARTLIAGPDAELVAAAAVGAPLLAVTLADAADAETRDDALLAASLEGRVMCVAGLDDVPRDQLERDLRALPAAPSLFLAPRAAGLERWFAVRVEVPGTGIDERAEAWRRCSGRDDVAEVAATFQLSLGQIAEAARTVRGDEPLSAAARRVAGADLGDIARLVPHRYTWDDLIVPERQRRVLRSVSGYLRHRDVVLRSWGYARAVSPSQGLKVLFAGESGTGKTMAAQVLARDLGLDLYQVDLALVVSKYIGETEKNLRRLFAAAARSSAILFFDEADALFGRRSEIRSSHDRHANVEVAYLLQLMEAHPGAVIMATNLRQNIDQAFLRRLDFVVEFPLPEEEDRARIWRRVLPAEAPLGDDVDVPFLAARFALSGGSIRNASLAAAFMAAENGTAIGMADLVRAVALEYDKLGRLTLEAEFEQFHPLVLR